MTLLADARPAGDSPGATSTALRVLQLNLCNSGIAGCYTGRSVAEAAAVIRAERPDLVTLNEVCRDDVRVLERTLSAAVAGDVVHSAFAAAIDRRTATAVRCRNGQRYGIAVLERFSAPAGGYSTHVGRYPVQDTADPEERVWLCLDAAPRFLACTTHLANANPSIALRQCRELVNVIVPSLRRGTAPLIVGGDLNLRPGYLPDVRSCLPPGFGHADDGGTQYVVAAGLTVAASKTISMYGTTDHPALLAYLEF